MYFRVAANQCSFPRGRRVDGLVSREGDGPLGDRTWNTTREFGDGWRGPVYDPTGGPRGRPCFDFDTNAGLKNFVGFDTPPLSATLTYYVVAKVRSFNPNSVPTNFLFTSGAGDVLTVRPSLVNGTKRFTVTSSLMTTNLPADASFEDGLFSIFIISVNGKQSKIKIGNMPVFTLELNSFVYRGIIVGRWCVDRNAGPGLDGAISELGMYVRAMDEDEIDELYLTLSRDAL